MPQNPPEGYTRVTPYLYYKDADAALDFLTGVFGFTEKFKMADDGGKTMHAEVELDGSVVMFGRPSADYKSPKDIGSHTSGVYVYVDDVDAHFEHAKEAGATITKETEDQFYGDRSYACEDPEGHQWWFATRVRDVSYDEMQNAMAASAS
jgi:PhnB protein